MKKTDEILNNLERDYVEFSGGVVRKFYSKNQVLTLISNLQNSKYKYSHAQFLEIGNKLIDKIRI